MSSMTILSSEFFRAFEILKRAGSGSYSPSAHFHAQVSEDGGRSFASRIDKFGNEVFVSFGGKVTESCYVAMGWLDYQRIVMIMKNTGIPRITLEPRYARFEDSKWDYPFIPTASSGWYPNKGEATLDGVDLNLERLVEVSKFANPEGSRGGTRFVQLKIENKTYSAYGTDAHVLTKFTDLRIPSGKEEEPVVAYLHPKQIAYARTLAKRSKSSISSLSIFEDYSRLSNATGWELNTLTSIISKYPDIDKFLADIDKHLTKKSTLFHITSLDELKKFKADMDSILKSWKALPNDRRPMASVVLNIVPGKGDRVHHGTVSFCYDPYRDYPKEEAAFLSEGFRVHVKTGHHILLDLNKIHKIISSLVRMKAASVLCQLGPGSSPMLLFSAKRMRYLMMAFETKSKLAEEYEAAVEAQQQTEETDDERETSKVED